MTTPTQPQQAAEAEECAACGLPGIENPTVPSYPRFHGLHLLCADCWLLTQARVCAKMATRRIPQPAAEGKPPQDGLLMHHDAADYKDGALPNRAQPSPVKADKRDPYLAHRALQAKRFGGDWDHAQQEIHAVTKLKDESSGRRERLVAALKADLSTSTAKRRQRLGARFDGRVGIDLEQAWSTPGDES